MLVLCAATYSADVTCETQPSAQESRATGGRCTRMRRCAWSSCLTACDQAGSSREEEFQARLKAEHATRGLTRRLDRGAKDGLVFAGPEKWSLMHRTHRHGRTRSSPAVASGGYSNV